MDAIKTFFKEIVTFNVVDGYNDTYSYNGILLEESSVAFQKRLQYLYEDALIEIPLLNNDVKNGFIGIIDRYRECQDGFDVPDELCLTSMNEEIGRGNRNPQLIRQRDFVQMLRECVSTQKYYLNEFATAIGYISEKREDLQAVALEEQWELQNQSQTPSEVENTSDAGLADEVSNEEHQAIEVQAQTPSEVENTSDAELVDKVGNEEHQAIEVQTQTPSEVENTSDAGLADMVSNEKQQESQDQSKTLSEEKDRNEEKLLVDGDWAYQYKGIMRTFKWGRNKVAKFLKDPYYSEAIVQEHKKIALNVPKARELMQKREQERKSPKRKK